MTVEDASGEPAGDSTDAARTVSAPPVMTERGPVRRGRRRAVRAGAGERDPLVDLRSADDSDVGWQAPSGGDSNDDRLRRDVPPHW